MDVVSLGLAGGSIISIDPRTGTPRIGPRSAGSYPGPVCYDHDGEEPTITDIDAVLNYLNPRYFLGGRAELDIEKARRAFAEKVAEPLGLDLLPAAASMYKLANSLFFDLLHKTTVQRGLDPRRFALVSFGGTAGMHVAVYGEPSASPHRRPPLRVRARPSGSSPRTSPTRTRSPTRCARPFDLQAVAGIYVQLEAASPRSSPSRVRPLRHGSEAGSRHAVPAAGAHRHGAVRRRRGDRGDARADRRAVRAPLRGEVRPTVGYREAGIELVSFRLRGSGRVSRHEFQADELADADPAHALAERVDAWVDKAGEVQEVPGFDFERLRPGNAIAGPAIVWTPITTLVVAPEQVARVDGYRNLGVGGRLTCRASWWSPAAARGSARPSVGASPASIVSVGRTPGEVVEVCDVTGEAAVGGSSSDRRNGRRDEQRGRRRLGTAGAHDARELARTTRRQCDGRLPLHMGCRASHGAAGYGRVVTVASTAAKTGARYAAYTASKHAALGLMRAVAAEVAGSVAANAVCPTFVTGGMTERTLARIVEATGRTRDEALAALERNYAAGRLLDPDEVAAAVWYLRFGRRRGRQRQGACPRRRWNAS